MDITVVETEDSPVWDAAPIQEPAGILRRGEEWVWVTRSPDGIMQVFRLKGYPWSPAP